uniref:Uncharacterized protein n=1 Tax=Oryza rufipogon TaxID=4529 RepID=A0A0E0P5G7_ORYRU
MTIDYRRTLDHAAQSEEEAEIIIQGVITLITTIPHPLPHLLGMDPKDDIANSLLPAAPPPLAVDVKPFNLSCEKYDGHPNTDLAQLRIFNQVTLFQRGLEIQK